MTEIAAPTTGFSASFAPLYLECLRIRNFRGLQDCVIELEPGLTLLVGRNNAGKSRVLRALAIALGSVPAELDDLTVDSDSEAILEVIVAPLTPQSEDDDDVFTDAVVRRLGAGGTQVVREEPARERFAWRTTIGRSAEGLGARSEMQTLLFDQGSQDWVLQPNPMAMSRDQRSLFLADLIEARRDLVEELTRRGSAVRRFLSDLEVGEAARSELETQLAELSSRIVGESATLAAIREALNELEQLVGGIGAPALNPLPMRLEELARSVSIDLDAGTGALPIRLHGAGARSLASLRIQGLLYDRRIGQDGPTMRPHPVTMIEEPEAHLHPQASLELAGLLASLPGQVIASTHSPHLVTAVEPRTIRLIRQADGTRVIDLGPAQSDAPGTLRAFRPSTHVQEMEKLKRLVERPFGELLFGSAIVIGDGATERAFLPVALRHALRTKAYGVCVIDPEGMHSPLAQAAVKFAQLADVPWLLFSDSDGPGKAASEALIRDYARGDLSRVIWVTGADGSETAAGCAIEQMLLDFDPEVCRLACLDVRPDLGTGDLLHLMSQLKGAVGPALARRLLERHDDHSQWPAPLRELVERLDAIL